MLLSYLVYTLLIIVSLIGVKVFANTYDDNYLDIEETKALSGIAAICVILHHISQRPAFQDLTKELFFFNDIGFLITSIFLFCSGYGLTVSLNKNPKYLDDFVKRRFSTILIPYALSNVVFSIYYFFNGQPLSKCLIGLTGLIAINPNGWFPVVLFVLYATFLFNNKIVKNKVGQFFVYLAVVILMYTIFCVGGHYAWWSGNGTWINPSVASNSVWWKQFQTLLFSGEWWVNSAIAFVLGVFYGWYKEKIVEFFKKGYIFKLIICVVLFALSYKIFRNVRDIYGYWSEYAFMGPGIKDKFITAAAQFLVPVFFILALLVLMMKIRVNNKFLQFMGKVSYETYLYGVLSLNLLSFLIGSYTPIVKNPYHYNLAIYCFGVIALSVLIGFIMNKVDSVLIKKFNKK